MGRTIYVTFRERDKTHLKAKCPNCGHETFDFVEKSDDDLDEREVCCQECNTISLLKEWKDESSH